MVAKNGKKQLTPIDFKPPHLIGTQPSSPRNPNPTRPRLECAAGHQGTPLRADSVPNIRQLNSQRQTTHLEILESIGIAYVHGGFEFKF